MCSLSNTEKNIVLRNRTIVVVKKQLTTEEKANILKKLLDDNDPILYSNEYERINRIKKIFDFFVLECVNDYYFRKPLLLSIIKEKLNDAVMQPLFGWELSSKYMCAIFPKSARIEYILLRSKKNKILNIKRKNRGCIYVRWVCFYSPTRTFRNVMDFIGSDYHHKL